MVIHKDKKAYLLVTILILIDGFLQLNSFICVSGRSTCHNPYFNRWFSAISYTNHYQISWMKRHNPYFNRWFSAILGVELTNFKYKKSQSLF